MLVEDVEFHKRRDVKEENTEPLKYEKSVLLSHNFSAWSAREVSQHTLVIGKCNPKLHMLFYLLFVQELRVHWKPAFASHPWHPTPETTISL